MSSGYKGLLDGIMAYLKHFLIFNLGIVLDEIFDVFG